MPLEQTTSLRIANSPVIRSAICTLLIMVMCLFALDWSFGIFEFNDYKHCAITAGPIVRITSTGKLRVSWESCKIAPAVFKWSMEDGATMNSASAESVSVSSNSMFWQSQYADIVVGNPTTEKLRMWIGDMDVSLGVAKAVHDASEPFVAVVIGDNQNGVSTFKRMLSKIAAEKPELIVHVGDMVQSGDSVSDWHKQFYAPLRSEGLLSTCPFITALGNHDVDSGTMSPPAMLSLPHGARFSAATVGPVRFIVLDTNIEDDAQIDWLSAQLASPAAKDASFRVLVAHIPPFIEYWDAAAWAKGESKWGDYMRTRVVPLLAEGHVDLVLSGHEHAYQRGEKDGVVYVVSGGAGGQLESIKVEDTGVYSKTALEHHYLRMSATADELKVTMRTLGGSDGDSFTISKRV